MLGIEPRALGKDGGGLSSLEGISCNPLAVYSANTLQRPR